MSTAMIEFVLRVFITTFGIILLPALSTQAQTIHQLNEKLECEAFEPVLENWKLKNDDLIDASQFLSQCYLDRMKSHARLGHGSEASYLAYFKDARRAVEALDDASQLDINLNTRRTQLEYDVCNRWSKRRERGIGASPFECTAGSRDLCHSKIKLAYDNQVFVGGDFEVPKGCEHELDLYNYLYNGVWLVDSMFDDLDMKTQTFISNRCPNSKLVYLSTR